MKERMKERISKVSNASRSMIRITRCFRQKDVNKPSTHRRHSCTKRKVVATKKIAQEVGLIGGGKTIGEVRREHRYTDLDPTSTVILGHIISMLVSSIGFALITLIPGQFVFYSGNTKKMQTNKKERKKEKEYSLINAAGGGEDARSTTLEDILSIRKRQ